VAQLLEGPASWGCTLRSGIGYLATPKTITAITDLIQLAA
jgi:hypothetical protein